ncbi:MAG TPA: outer membrane beta-barrel protein [Blastocatellia bacterium]|nr:outer membrane beta-barrel protein [Blastocatellia bacterium]
MIRLKMPVIALIATISLVSSAMAQEASKNEVSVQGTGFFTSDTTGNGIAQHTTDSGGLLVSYRYHLNRFLAADGSYGYTRNTFQNLAPGGAFNVQSNVHQVTGALVLTSPWKFGLFKPFALAGSGVLNFDPTGNPAGPVIGAVGQTKGVFLYGAGADLDLNKRFAFRLEYRGLVYDRPDFGLGALNSGRTTHTAQPSAGFVIRF